MNKLFKTLFTLLLGIFLLILTFTANSAAKSLGEQLVQLEELLGRGAITQEEFLKAKSILLKMDVDSSKKIEKIKKKLTDREKQKLKKEINEKKSYTTEIRQYAASAKGKWEKTEFIFDDYRVYAHRPGAIKIRRISDGKQLAVFSSKFKIKYSNGGEALFKTTTFEENILEKKGLDNNLRPLAEGINESLKNIFGERKKLPGKIIIEYNGAKILSWERAFVPAHNAHFFQLLALDDQPFHFYIVHPKGDFALNMAQFVKKIDLAVAEVKKELQEKYNLTPEEMDRIIKERKDNLDKQLASISRETSQIIEQEASKAIESEVASEVASAVDSELVKELEAAVGAAVAEEFISAVEQASGQAIDRALSSELAIEIDRAISEAVSEGISAAAAEAGIRAGLAALAEGKTMEEATAACTAAAGTQC